MGTNWDLGGIDGIPKARPEDIVLDALEINSITETMGRRSLVII